ncbi:MAG: HypC/HybG/HupF family hydrogenase formation chaperone [Desulfobacteraceae bacterium]|nr:HypC/HybG/HupF family hydrogenase formation chaperone [Desulfobacteraceae bacterium]
MCLAVPSKITEINKTTSMGIVDVDGVTREASLMLLDDVKIGDYVIVHAGFAISKVDRQSAEQTLADIREMLAIDNQIRSNEDQSHKGRKTESE